MFLHLVELTLSYECNIPFGKFRIDKMNQFVLCLQIDTAVMDCLCPSCGRSDMISSKKELSLLYPSGYTYPKSMRLQWTCKVFSGFDYRNIMYENVDPFCCARVT